MSLLPTKEQVRLIFKDTYNLYLKYISMSFIDWNAFHTEYSNLCKRYPYDITVDIVTDIVEIVGREKGGFK